MKIYVGFYVLIGLVIFVRAQKNVPTNDDVDNQLIKQITKNIPARSLKNKTPGINKNVSGIPSAEIPALLFNEMQTELPMEMSDHISWISNPTIDYFTHEFQPIEYSNRMIDSIEPIHSISYVITPPIEDPCTSTGLSYACFSEATAKQCQRSCESFRHQGESNCGWGSVEWCASYSNALRCNQVSYCKEFNWFKDPLENPCYYGPSYTCYSDTTVEQCNYNTCTDIVHPGESSCDWGYIEWCASYSNAQRCNKVEYCSGYSWFKTPLIAQALSFPTMAPPMLVPMMMLFNFQLFTGGTELSSSRSMVPFSMQSNPCDQGLSYECFSEATAAQCNTYCQSLTHAGDSNCDWGAIEWCANSANTQRCDKTSYCETHVWITVPPINDPCQYGANYTCFSSATAQQCHYTTCDSYIHIGPSSCQWGPFEWCASYENAQRCNQTSFCDKYEWFKSFNTSIMSEISNTIKEQSVSQIVLTDVNPCGLGTNYWCFSQATANQCNQNCKSYRNKGTSNCDWGSVEWCASYSNADNCNKIEYCTKFSWFIIPSIRSEISSIRMMIPNMMLYYIPQSEESDLSLYNIKNSGGSFQENNPCNQGLSYECFSEATAAQCGHVCQSYTHEGESNCDWGDIEWCANFENSKRCNQVSYCQTHKWIIIPPNDNPCQYGSNYSCFSLATAQQCNYTSCQNYVHTGESNCLWGPFEWCASYVNAKRCNQVSFCERYSWFKVVASLVSSSSSGSKPCSSESSSSENQTMTTEIVPQKENPCTVGKEYWCFSEATAKQCNQKCETYQHKGASKCKWGPTEWCTNYINAKRCNKMTYCETFKWTEYSSQKNPCELGTSYACFSAATAEQCNTTCPSLKYSGISQCSWGHNEWCANYKNAERCNEIIFCSRFSWFELSSESFETSTISSGSQASVSYVNQCELGNSYQCFSVATAERCNADCSSYIHPGPSNCSWGQYEWCANYYNALRCNKLAYCSTYTWITSPPESNPCDYGLEYVCFSLATANQCGYTNCPKYIHSGQSQCVWGAIEWCASYSNAQQCDKLVFCQRFSWFKTLTSNASEIVPNVILVAPVVETPVLPSNVSTSMIQRLSVVSQSSTQYRMPHNDTSSYQPIQKTPCELGIEYWCFSRATAKNCNYVRCKTFAHTGPSKCEWGEIEWCASSKNAKRCRKTKFCMKFIWFKQKHSKLNGIPGKYSSTSSSSKLSQHSPCEQGVEYWCFSRATAQNCKYVECKTFKNTGKDCYYSPK